MSKTTENQEVMAARVRELIETGKSKGVLTHKEIVELLLAKNPHVRIVANAVTMETAAELSEAAKPFSYSDICCVNVSRGRKMGRYHLMIAQNPVYIVTMQN